jgi:benzoate/toluate 1,2-dioxygenase reductase subunit
MGHMIALNFEDGVTRFIDCAATETVADASYRVGINIPLDCRDGACGTCKAFVESGTYTGGDYIEDALSHEEAAQGFALACQMRPTSDLVLRVLAGSQACKTRPAVHTAAIARLIRLSETTTAFTLRIDGAPVGFLPGQYVNIQVPGTVHHRSYSFSSAPGAAEAAFLVRNILGGQMTGFLAAAEPGATVSFTGPIGSFYLRDVTRPVLMLAGGTGLAPFLSMLGRLAETGCAHPVHLVYGVTRDADLVHVEELAGFAARLPGFSFLTVVAEETSAHPRKGWVTQHLDAGHLNGGDVDVYLCGPPPMVDAVRSHFEAQGVKPASFHFEKFAPSGVAA